MVKLFPTIRYKDVSFIKVYIAARDNTTMVNVIYKRADDHKEESIAPFESLYFRVRPENLHKKFGNEELESHVETDFYYDEEGASDQASKNELDELLSWCDFVDDYECVKEGLIERSKQITTCFHIDESTEDEFYKYYRQFLAGNSYDEIIWQANEEAYKD